MAQTATLHQLSLLVERLAERQGGRELVLIDGYPGAGKTSFAMELAAMSRVAWTPIDVFVTDDRIDVRRIRKDLVRPFKREGKVREVVPSMGSAGLQRGRPVSGTRVLILEGMGVAEVARALRADQLWWMDCDTDIRVERMSGASTGIPGASYSDMKHKLIQAEAANLRGKALKIADVVVATDDEPPPKADKSGGRKVDPNPDVDPEAVAQALGSTTELLGGLSATDEAHLDVEDDDDLDVDADDDRLLLPPSDRSSDASDVEPLLPEVDQPIPGAPRPVRTEGDGTPSIPGAPPLNLAGFVIDDTDALSNNGLAADADHDDEIDDDTEEAVDPIDDLLPHAGVLDEDADSTAPAGPRDELDDDLLPASALSTDSDDPMGDLMPSWLDD